MNKNNKETVQIEEDKNVSKKSKKDLKAENVKIETNIEASSNDVTETKTELTPIEKNVESTQLSFTSKAAQKEHVKNMKLKFEQETVIEKERIEAERARLKQAIIDIQAEIEKSKIKSVKVWEQAKFEEAKLIEEAIKNKKLEEEELRKRHDLLKQRQNDIALLNQQHAQKDVKFREEFAAKKADAVQKIKLAKLQIKEELEAQRRAVKQRELEQVAMAIELKQRLKEEKMELERQKLEEKRAFKQEVAQMKLELFAEKNRQQQELYAKKIEARNKKLAELQQVQAETEQLKSERARAIEAAKLARIKENIELERKKNQLVQDLKGQAIEIESLKEDQAAEIEAIREINDLEVQAVADANNVLIQKTTMITANELAELNAASTVDVEALALKTFIQDYVTLVSEFKGFDKKGEEALARVKKPIKESTLKKFLRHPYYGPMVESYNKIEAEGNFINLEEIIIGGHIISQDPIHDEVIKAKIKTLQKAALQGIPVKIGLYYLMPVKKSGIDSFYVSHHLKDGEVIFDNRKIFSNETIKGIEQIVEYKFEQGASIRIIDGLGIANKDGNLSVAIFPNIIK